MTRAWEIARFRRALIGYHSTTVRSLDGCINETISPSRTSGSSESLMPQRLASMPIAPLEQDGCGGWGGRGGGEDGCGGWGRRGGAGLTCCAASVSHLLPCTASMKTATDAGPRHALSCAARRGSRSIEH